jgi:hypothetical protein
MLASVQFDYQPRLPANEIRDVWPNRKLPDEMMAAKPVGLEFDPQQSLGLRPILSHRAGESR